MKLEEAAPPRLEEEGPEALRALVRSHQVGPTNAALERMSKLLDTAVVSGAVDSKSAGPPSSQRLLRYKLGALVLVIAGGLVFSWRERASTRASSGAGDSALVPVAHEARAVNPPATTEADAAQAPVARAEAAVVSVDELPPVQAPSGRHGVAVPGRTTGATEGRETSAGSTELDLIQRAQTALLSDPRRALVITDEHTREYPSGEFVQEREVIAVEALMMLGQRDQGTRRARALARSFPSTPYATRLEKAMGHPLFGSPTGSEPPLPTP